MVSSSSTLAIDGGTPVRATLLPYGRQSIDDDDIQAVVDVLRSDWLTTGPQVEAFEECFAHTVRARFAVAVSNGTAALHAAAFAAGLADEDEAVVPALTFAASANCVRFQRARPVFVDVRRDTLNICPEAVESAITPRTRAIIAVDYTGQPADLNELTALANHYKLVLIEDAAHALGATYHGRRVGTAARMTTFSLHPVKHITTGEGGMITTDDPELAQRIRRFRSHGIGTDHHQRSRNGAWFYEMTDLGYNYRLSDIQCALGMSQLNKLQEWLLRRREIAARYTSAFAGLEEIETPTVLPDRESAWHLYVIRLNLQRLRVGRADVFRALRAENIGVNVHYIPVPWHPYYRALGYQRGSWPIAEDAYERMLSLPLFPLMNDSDVNDVVDAVHKVIGCFRS